MSKTFTSKVIADGRVTLPKEIRENQTIQEGDLVELCFVRKIKTNREIDVKKEA